MNKRNTVIAIITTAVIGSGVAYAGSKSCKGGSWHDKGLSMDHKVEHILEKADHKLDLTAEQQDQLRAILQANQSFMEETRETRKSLKWEVMELDPGSPEYQAQVTALSEKVAEQARTMVLKSAEIVEQVATVLTEDQRKEAMRIIDKRLSNFDHHDHG